MIFLVAVMTAALADPGVQRIAVLDLAPQGTPPELARTLTQAIADEAAKIPGNTAMSQEDIAAALTTERQKQLLGNSDESSLTELGNALGANQVLSGSLGKVGESFVLQLQLFDPAHAKVLDRKSRTVTDEADLLMAARDLVHQLLTGLVLDTTGKLKLAIDPAGATISIDGKAVGTSPLEGALPLEEGRHKLTIQKDGFVTYEATLEAVRDQTLFNATELVPLAQLEAGGGGNWQKTTGWISLGVSAAAFGSATYFGIQAVNAYGKYQNAAYDQGDQSVQLYGAAYYRQQTVSNQTPANISFALGGATVALAIALEIWGYLQKPAPAATP